MKHEDLRKIGDYIWEIPQEFRFDMRVPARIFANEKLLNDLFKDRSLEQLVNVAALPGIQKWALAMPDIHEGYGFPIGGVAAMDLENGVISPGGIGYDINCGVRLLKSPYTYQELKNKIPILAKQLYEEVPSGVGRGGRFKLSNKELDEILEKGAEKIKSVGQATEEDIQNCEAEGYLKEANPDKISKIAKNRGRDQLGTLGAGNHFLEIQFVEEIFDFEAAKNLGIFKNQMTIMIHCGSRGLGHQNATDYIRALMSAMPKYGIKLPDPELACVPFSSPEGQNYWEAMSAAANFAWANRQVITWEVRGVWKKVFQVSSIKCQEELKLIFDIAHNLAKIEEYNGKKVIIHRKGATRAFPDQPILIPGSMGTSSFLLIGQPKAMELSFGSTCHGAGRTMSRTKAKKIVRGWELKQKLEKEGIIVCSRSMSSLAEEAPMAYKNVEEITDVVHKVGIAKKVARLKPLAVIKG